MNNDLISREALKKKFSEESYWTYTHEYGNAIPIGWIISAIDNAPSAIDNEGLELAFNNGYKQAKKENYKILIGEWKVKTISTFPQYQPDEYECPFCKIIVNYKTNYCHNCGAYMRGYKHDVQ